MIKLIVDSTCDIPVELLKMYNIKTLPIIIDINENSYKDRVDISPEEFYEAIREKGMFPKTAQINPAVFADAFESEIEKGNEIICLTISSKLSGTYNSANIAKDMVGSNMIHIVDSRGASMTFGLVVLEIVKMIDRGMSVNQILPKIDEFISKQESILCVDSLEMLGRGGRIPSSVATIGNLLGVKPILTFKDGELVVVSKQRGVKKSLNYIMSFIRDCGVDVSTDVYIAHANNISGANNLKELIEESFSDIDVKVTIIGPAVGAHVGEGAIGVFFAKK